MADKMIPNFLNYTTMGYRPIKTTYHLDCDQMTDAIRTIATKEIDGIVDVTYEIDQKTGAVGWFIWFDTNADHFVDRNTTQTMLGTSIRRFSPKFTAFAKKFGYRESDDDVEHGSNKVNLKNIVHGNENPEVRRKLTYLKVAINPFISIMFDSKGVAYSKEFGQEPPKVTIERKYIWRKGSSGSFHRLVGITVEKYLTNAYRDYQKPQARHAAHLN